MDNSYILSHVDHSLLNPCASWENIRALCDEAVKHRTASVCVPPSYVKRIRDEYGSSLVICTVVGFPLGYDTTAAKVAGAKAAIDDGAAEIDMVVNLTDVKNGDFSSVTREISSVKDAIGGSVLKVIIEACYLSDEEKAMLCRCVTDGGADYIKTSTGFGKSGAAMEDVLLFKKHIGPNVKIKAAGGIRTREDMEAFINAGCVRIGTSSAVKLLCAND